MKQATGHPRKRVLFILVALIVGMGIAAGGWFLLRGQGPAGSEPDETAFQRMLAFVPDEPDYHDEIWFSDLRRLMDAHSMPDVRSSDDLDALPDSERKAWFRLFFSIYGSEFSGGQRAPADWRNAFGYDRFLIDREITAGLPPRWFGVMEGTFDTTNIIDALRDLDYKEQEYNGTVYYSINKDYGIDTEHEVGRLALSHLNRLVVSPDRLIATTATEILEQVLDTMANRRGSLADNASYAALAQAMGPVVSGVIVQGERFYVQGEASIPPEALKQEGKLHFYKLVGIGYLDDGVSQRIVIAMVYDNPQDAEADALVLASRLEGDVRSLASDGQMLSDYWTAGETQVNTFKGGATLTVHLELKDTAPPGLWMRMVLYRDLPFLVVGE